MFGQFTCICTWGYIIFGLSSFDHSNSREIQASINLASNTHINLQIYALSPIWLEFPRPTTENSRLSSMMLRSFHLLLIIIFVHWRYIYQDTLFWCNDSLQKYSQVNLRRGKMSVTLAVDYLTNYYVSITWKSHVVNNPVAYHFKYTLHLCLGFVSLCYHKMALKINLFFFFFPISNK